jgi:hypothetical protein
MSAQPMTDDPRIKTVAKALARNRLGKLDLKLGQNPELQHSILEKAVENLWRSLLDDARAVVEALDQAAFAEPPDRTTEHSEEYEEAEGSEDTEFETIADMSGARSTAGSK